MASKGLARSGFWICGEEMVADEIADVWQGKELEARKGRQKEEVIRVPPPRSFCIDLKRKGL